MIIETENEIIKKLKPPYEEYEASRLWEFVKSSIEDLVENNRIQAGSIL